LNRFIEWYADNPVFTGSDPVNSCTTSGGDVYYCITVNLYDTVYWFVPSPPTVRPPPEPLDPFSAPSCVFFPLLSQLI
jgi:hypothetical protein